MKKMTMIVSAILTAAMLVTPMSAFADDVLAPPINPANPDVQNAIGPNNTFVPDGWIEGEGELNYTPYNLLDSKIDQPELDQVQGTPSGRAVVMASVSPTYMVTIPTAIELEGADAGKFKGTFDIKASNVFLEEGKGIMVSLAEEEQNEFTMQALGAEKYLLNYTVTSEVYGDVNKQKRNLAIFATDNDLVQFSAIAEGSNEYKNAFYYIQEHYRADEKEFRESVTIQTEKPLYAGFYVDTVTFNIGVANVQSEVLDVLNHVGQQQNAGQPLDPQDP